MHKQTQISYCNFTQEVLQSILLSASQPCSFFQSFNTQVPELAALVPGPDALVACL